MYVVCIALPVYVANLVLTTHTFTDICEIFVLLLHLNQLIKIYHSW